MKNSSGRPGPHETVTRLEELRPDLSLRDRLAAHVSWANNSTHAVINGGEELDWETHILAWKPAPHPLAELFSKAVENGHRVTVIDETGVTKFNQEADHGS